MHMLRYTKWKDWFLTILTKVSSVFNKDKLTGARLPPATSKLMCRRSTNWACVSSLPILSVSLFGVPGYFILWVIFLVIRTKYWKQLALWPIGLKIPVYTRNTQSEKRFWGSTSYIQILGDKKWSFSTTVVLWERNVSQNALYYPKLLYFSYQVSFLLPVIFELVPNV